MIIRFIKNLFKKKKEYPDELGRIVFIFEKDNMCTIRTEVIETDQETQQVLTNIMYHLTTGGFNDAIYQSLLAYAGDDPEKLVFVGGIGEYLVQIMQIKAEEEFEEDDETIRASDVFRHEERDE